MIKEKDLYKYSATIVRVVDGDTVICLVDLGMKVFKQVVLRLANVNTSELNSKDTWERVKAKAAKAFLAEKLPEGCPIYFDSTGLDKYDRSIAHVYIPGSRVSVNVLLVDSGHATFVDY